MKKYTDLILVSVIILIGAFFLIKNYSKGPASTPNPQVLADDTASNTSPKNNSVVTYLMYTTSFEKRVIKQKEQAEVDAAFKDSGFLIIPEVYSFKKTTLENALNAQSWSYDIGATNIQYYGHLIRGGVKLTPAFIYDAESACTMVVDVVAKKDSKIKTIKDLSGKSIAFAERKLIADSMLIDQNVKIKKLYIRTSMDWTAKSLMDNTLDAAILTYRKAPGTKEVRRKKLTLPFEKFPSLKVMTSIDTGIPCDIVYLNKELTTEEQQKIIKELKKLNQANTDKSRKALYIIGAQSPLKEIPEEMKLKINSLFDNTTVYADEMIDPKKE